LALADFDLTKMTHSIVVCEWTTVEGKAATDNRVGSFVPTLKVVANWLKFECQSEAHSQIQCSAVLVHSIAYPIQVHQVPMLKKLDADFVSLNADPFMMVHLGGAQYRADNARVFGLLTLWICHTDWWTYRRRFEATCNSRGIWLCSYQSLST
jgi:hypothetical protein